MDFWNLSWTASAAHMSTYLGRTLRGNDERPQWAAASQLPILEAVHGVFMEGPVQRGMLHAGASPRPRVARPAGPRPGPWWAGSALASVVHVGPESRGPQAGWFHSSGRSKRRPEGHDPRTHRGEPRTRRSAPAERRRVWRCGPDPQTAAVAEDSEESLVSPHVSGRSSLLGAWPSARSSISTWPEDPGALVPRTQSAASSGVARGEPPPHEQGPLVQPMTGNVPRDSLAQEKEQGIVFRSPLGSIMDIPVPASPAGVGSSTQDHAAPGCVPPCAEVVIPSRLEPGGQAQGAPAMPEPCKVRLQRRLLKLDVACRSRRRAAMLTKLAFARWQHGCERMRHSDEPDTPEVRAIRRAMHYEACLDCVVNLGFSEVELRALWRAFDEIELAPCNGTGLLKAGVRVSQTLAEIPASPALAACEALGGQDGFRVLVRSLAQAPHPPLPREDAGPAVCSPWAMRRALKRG
mmetsp:Transcript_103783/g.293405  ORF Transcript_103783/g.293405 Transcript_103783/m.293405 type:complete len:464 (+) Transcript_103783:96-1487(+)